jgi:archaellum component FlaF (FlaF/FlaG flagellin family)
MNGFLLKNPQGFVGLAVVAETRKVRLVVYDSIEKNLIVTFDNGAEEHLPTEINVAFNGALLASNEILVAHFPTPALDRPSSEYHVPLRQ